MAKGRKWGQLTGKYARVATNQRRIVWRPYQKPRRLFYVTSAGVIVCNPDTYNKDAILARGYHRVTAPAGMFVFEKRI